jgi:hypothetical protein
LASSLSGGLLATLTPSFAQSFFGVARTPSFVLLLGLNSCIADLQLYIKQLQGIVLVAAAP